MSEAKLTSKGQITIPIEIRRLLHLQAGDQVSFTISENGIIIDKANRPLTIEERFATYDLRTANEKIKESMKEIEVGNDVGEEEL